MAASAPRPTILSEFKLNPLYVYAVGTFYIRSSLMNVKNNNNKSKNKLGEVINR